MCGIAGIFNTRGEPCPRKLLMAMHAAILHRGPDDSGCFADGEIGLAFQRLSILDLRGGHQPMTSRDGRFTLVFNGEIYNHKELRGPLAGAGWRFRTDSDAETLLAGFYRHGAGIFQKLNGMFSCAVWDAVNRSLTLARDPLGIKPLYLYRKNGLLCFASELRALLAGGAEARLSPSAVMDYLTFGYTHSPDTVIEGIEKFPAGHYMTSAAHGRHAPVRYWTLPSEERGGKAPDEREAAAELKSLLELAVRDQMMGDVPIGLFLSGGLDSSLVAALMARSARGPVQTYSVGFDGGESVDETRYAEAVSSFLGTRHETIRLGAGILDEIGSMAGCLDEPIADAAILPTLYLSRQARRSVKVVLTGEGGDEVFGGYGRHKAASVTQWLEGVPAWLKPCVLPAARKTGGGAYFRALPLNGANDWAGAESAPYRLAAAKVMSPAAVNASASRWLSTYESLRGVNGMLAFDMQTSMADQLLMKLDKTTMRASLEARVPLLDLRLVDFMFRLPASFKVRRFRGKYLLRKAVKDLVPKAVLTRRKHGFVLTCAGWIRSPGNRLFSDALGGGSLPGTGLFSREALLEGVSALRAGSRAENQVFYFRLLVLSLWLEEIRRFGQ